MVEPSCLVLSLGHVFLMRQESPKKERLSFLKTILHFLQNIGHSKYSTFSTKYWAFQILSSSTPTALQGKAAAQAGDLTEARALFMEATASEADCVEAIYNLGLVSKALGNPEDALTAFKKLNSILTDDAAAMFQVLYTSTKSRHLHNISTMVEFCLAQPAL